MARGPMQCIGFKASPAFRYAKRCAHKLPVSSLLFATAAPLLLYFDAITLEQKLNVVSVSEKPMWAMQLVQQIEPKQSN